MELGREEEDGGGLVRKRSDCNRVCSKVVRQKSRSDMGGRDGTWEVGERGKLTLTTSKGEVTIAPVIPPTLPISITQD